MNEQLTTRLRQALGTGVGKAVKTVWFLLKIMVPTSLAVALLQWSGLLKIFAQILTPLMRLIGLPGQAALAIISGALLNNYSAIAVMGTLSLTARDATIVAVMCLIAHNLIVETAVMKSAGSSALKMICLRLGTAIVAAFILNLLLPASMARMSFSTGIAAGEKALLETLRLWGISTVLLVGKITAFVFAIMLVQSLFEEFKLMDFLSKLFAPFMKLFGLSADSSFLWIVINIVGYSYGAGIIMAEYESGRLKKQQGDLFNHHAAISHSLMEDTILYAAVGLPVFWLMLPRILLACAAVWLERFRRSYFRKSFRAGTV